MAGRERQDRAAALLRETRALATRQAVVDQAVADRLGLAATDLRCLGVLEHGGPVTAGALAEVTGLTTGAITGVIDRLERAGLALRRRDPADRRKVVVHAVVERGARVGELYEPMLRELRAWCDARTPAELDLVLDFLRVAGDGLPVLAREIRRSRVPEAGQRLEGGKGD